MWWQWLALGLGFFTVAIGFFIYKKKQEKEKVEQEANKPLQQGAPPEKGMLEELMGANPNGRQANSPVEGGSKNNSEKKPNDQQPNLSPEMLQQFMQSMGGEGVNKNVNKKKELATNLYDSRPISILPISKSKSLS
jgi:hypothetical protein